MTSLELLSELDITSAVINYICFINKLPSVRNRDPLQFHAILLTFQMVLLRRYTGLSRPKLDLVFEF